MTKNNDAIFEYIQSKYFEKFVRYVIDSKYRKAVHLKSWLKAQSEQPKIDVETFSDTIHDFKNVDAQITEILRTIKKKVTYKTDTVLWGFMEKWQTAFETVSSMKGDCEDGAILMYIIARLHGVPANRLLLFAGTVYDPYRKKYGGHCWLGYRSKNYQLNWTFQDWCYYYDNRGCNVRNKFYIKDKKIHEYKLVGNGYRKVASNYIEIWFGFNEEGSYTSLANKR